MLEIPVAADERVVLADLLALPLRGRFPASDKDLFEGRDCFRKKSMVKRRERNNSRLISFICKRSKLGHIKMELMQINPVG